MFTTAAVCRRLHDDWLPRVMEQELGTPLVERRGAQQTERLFLRSDLLAVHTQQDLANHNPDLLSDRAGSHGHDAKVVIELHAELAVVEKRDQDGSAVVSGR